MKHYCFCGKEIDEDTPVHPEWGECECGASICLL
jgi:hypothetical protein